MVLTPQISIFGQTVGEQEYKPDTTRLGLVSAPSLPAARSLFSSQDSLLFLSLTCQDLMTFELC